MGIFEWVRNKAVGSFQSAFLGTFGSRLSYMLGNNMNGKQSLEQYRNWVFVCVHARAEEVGNIQLRLYNGDKEVQNHELLDLLNKVNPSMTKHELFSATQAFKDLDGNAFWFLVRDKGNVIREIYLLRPDRVEILVDKENPLNVKGYVYRINGQSITFEPNEIIHHKTFNPMGEHPFPHKGIGIVRAAQWAIETDNEARQWNFSFFKNSATPNGFLIREGVTSITKEEHTRLKAEFNQTHQGAENAFKVALLAGPWKWQEASRSQKDMDFLEQRRFGRDEILSMFRVPKAVVGIVEDVNRANADASIYLFAARTVKPQMQQIVDTLNEFLVREFGEGLRLEFVSPVPDDRAQVVNEYALGLDKWLTRNEIRAREGLPPTTEGDQIFGTLAQLPIDELPKPKKVSSKQIEKKTVKTGTVAEQVISKFLNNRKHALSIEAVAKYKELWVVKTDNRADGVKADLRAFFSEQEKEVQKNLERIAKTSVDSLFDDDHAVTASINLITPRLKKWIEESGGDASELVGSSFDPENPRIAKFIAKRAKYFAKEMNKTTADALVASIQEGQEAGETLAELSERVAEIYDQARDFRTDRIARTEASAAGNFGSQEAYQQAGIEQWEWVVVDPKDEDCLANDGEVVDIGEKFSSGDARPPVHPNCVCTTIPIVK